MGLLFWISTRVLERSHTGSETGFPTLPRGRRASARGTRRTASAVGQALFDAGFAVVVERDPDSEAKSLSCSHTSGRAQAATPRRAHNQEGAIGKLRKRHFAPQPPCRVQALFLLRTSFVSSPDRAVTRRSQRVPIPKPMATGLPLPRWCKLRFGSAKHMRHFPRDSTEAGSLTRLGRFRAPPMRLFPRRVST